MGADAVTRKGRVGMCAAIDREDCAGIGEAVKGEGLRQRDDVSAIDQALAIGAGACAACFRGAIPNRRVYSRLNCAALL